MIKIFDTLEKYNTYTNNGQNLESGFLYYVKEDNSTHYYTNNIDGVSTIYDTVETPSGNIEITENAESLDIAEYASATVAVPIPEGYIIPTGNKEITANGENIDVNDYATASVAVPQPTGSVSITQNGTDIDIAQYATANVNVQPSGNISITQNGENIDIAQYATATVNVASVDPSDMINLIEGDTVTLNIPSGITRIKDHLFSNNTNLTSLTIPNSVTSIGQYGFQGCTNIGTTDNYVKYIDGWAVDLESTNRSSYTIKEGTMGIIDGLFYSNSSVSTISLPSTILYIPSFFVAQCNGISTITIPNSVTTIGSDAFNGCRNLTTITIPNSVTTIGNRAFTYCSGLTSITIPSSVTSIGNGAFQATGLTSVTVEATTPPTLGSTAFNQNASGRKIYVPSESVEAYKAATNWSSYAASIEAIPSPAHDSPL